MGKDKYKMKYGKVYVALIYHSVGFCCTKIILLLETTVRKFLKAFRFSFTSRLRLILNHQEIEIYEEFRCTRIDRF